LIGQIAQQVLVCSTEILSLKKLRFYYQDFPPKKKIFRNKFEFVIGEGDIEYQ